MGQNWQLWKHWAHPLPHGEKVMGLNCAAKRCWLAKANEGQLGVSHHWQRALLPSTKELRGLVARKPPYQPHAVSPHHAKNTGTESDGV